MAENHLPDRWKKYTQFGSHIVPKHFPKEVTHGAAAKLIPQRPSDPFPAADSDDNCISASAFGQWISKGIPKDRYDQFGKVTGIPIAVWLTPDDSDFERALRRAAGRAIGWLDLVKQRAAEGRMRVIAEESPVAGVQQLRLVPADFDPAAKERGIELLWPGCRARIWVRQDQQPQRESDRRAWLLSDYGDKRYLLDPLGIQYGGASSSRLGEASWRRDSERGGGHIILPRGSRDYVWIPDAMTPGTRFDVLLLVFNLENQPEAIRLMFDDLERRWQMPLEHLMKPIYQAAIGSALEEATALIEERDIPFQLFLRRCKVVDRANVIGDSVGRINPDRAESV